MSDNQTVEEVLELLISRIDQHKKNDATLATRNFLESLRQLQRRATSVGDVQVKMASFDERSDTPMSDLQDDLKDRTDAFFQQVYATISNLVRLLKFILPVSQSSQMPTRSIEKFLKWANQEFSVQQQVVILEEARSFRAYFIDHVEHSSYLDWMTMSGPDAPGVLIYLERPSGKLEYGVYAPSGPLDPYDPKFTPPVEFKSFKVSPNIKSTYEATIRFYQRILEELVPDITP